MTDIDPRSREFLAQAYESGIFRAYANEIRSGVGNSFDEELRAITAALRAAPEGFVLLPVDVQPWMAEAYVSAVDAHLGSLTQKEWAVERFDPPKSLRRVASIGIAAMLSASPTATIATVKPPGDLDQQFRDPTHLALWLGELVSNEEEWDAAQAGMQGVRAFMGEAAVIERLQAAIEGECSGLAISSEQAKAIFHYVLQPLEYAEEPALAGVRPPADLQTKLGEVS